MNILFITHYAEMYGANKSLIDLIEGLKAHGVSAKVVMPRQGELCEVLEALNVPYVIQEFKDWVHLPLKYKSVRFNSFFLFLKKIKLRFDTSRFNSKSITSLRSIIQEEKIDLVYSNSSVFNFGYNYSRKYNIPHAWHFREVQEHYNIHWTYSRRVVNKSFKKSRLVFAISNYVKKNYEVKNNVNDIIVEYDSVLSEARLLEIDADRQKIYKDSDIVTFGMVALVHPNKGQIEAVKALAIVAESYPNVRLLIAGGGHVSKLNEVINQLNIKEKVVSLGHLPNPYKAFLDMDIYLMCSKKEGLGRVTLEAMACGLPVIGYKDGGTIELINENVNGIFYDGDFKDLSNKMIHLIENPDLKDEMGSNGRKMFEEKFTNEIYAQKMFSHIKKYV